MPERADSGHTYDASLDLATEDLLRSSVCKRSVDGDIAHCSLSTRMMTLATLLFPLLRANQPEEMLQRLHERVWHLKSTLGTAASFSVHMKPPEHASNVDRSIMNILLNIAQREPEAVLYKNWARRFQAHNVLRLTEGFLQGSDDGIEKVLHSIGTKPAEREEIRRWTETGFQHEIATSSHVFPENYEHALSAWLYRTMAASTWETSIRTHALQTPKSGLEAWLRGCWGKLLETRSISAEEEDLRRFSAEYTLLEGFSALRKDAQR